MGMDEINLILNKNFEGKEKFKENLNFIHRIKTQMIRFKNESEVNFDDLKRCLKEINQISVDLKMGKVYNGDFEKDSMINFVKELLFDSLDYDRYGDKFKKED